MMLDGKIAIVTGAAKGIGRAITHRFAQEGASVLAVDSNAPEVRRVVAEIWRAGGTAAAMVVDVSRHLAARRIVAEAIRRYRRAVNMLTRGMAVALAPYKIRVVAIGPGTVLTSTTQYLLHDKVAYDRIMARMPIGRLGQPEEIAAIAAFLASKDASFITGTTVYADGGRLALNGVTMWPVSGRNRR